MIILNANKLSIKHNYKFLVSSSTWYRECICLTTNAQVIQTLPLTSMVGELRHGQRGALSSNP